MKKKVFVDTDIFLDTIFNRKSHSTYANKILALCELNEIIGVTSSLVVANIYYIVSRISNNKKALRSINKIRSFINILPFTDSEIGESINAEFKDFEDGVQYFIAVKNKVDCIITRNVKDFKKSNIGVFTPREFLESIKINPDIS